MPRLVLFLAAFLGLMLAPSLALKNDSRARAEHTVHAVAEKQPSQKGPRTLESILRDRAARKLGGVDMTPAARPALNRRRAPVHRALPASGAPTA